MFREGSRYDRNSTSGLRNTDNNLVNMSADICTFNQPTYNLVGAGKIPESGTTTADTYVHIITTATTIPLTFNFTGNVESFSSNTAVFNYETYKHDKRTNIFQDPSILTSEDFSYSAITGTSAITQTIVVSRLTLDGDYLIKGYYKYPSCTKFLGAIGDENNTSDFKKGSSYNLYNSDLDYYFTAFNAADKPVIEGNTNEPATIGAIEVSSVISDGISDIPSPSPSLGTIIVNLNGLTQALQIDYNITSGGTVEFTEGTVDGDIITFAYVTESETSIGFTTDRIGVGVIPSGVTNGEGSSTYYYNTTEGKYEVYTSLTPTSSNDIIVSLNGVTLANGVDYFQSITNSKRVILNGVIKNGDEIILNYLTTVAIQGNVFTNNPIIDWTISTKPVTDDGEFTIEVSTGSTFGVITSSATTSYEIGQGSYSASILLSGDYGDTLYYRIKNNKIYTTLNGDKLSNVSYSDTVSVIISSNVVNSY
jgi:hypothetical protein|tara:strand:+ start:10872 stop:12308 length:1437 start_codon:yes stop_codon:yes gene_type:complete